MSMAQVKTGLVSVTFRQKSVEEIIALTAEAGLSGVDSAILYLSCKGRDSLRVFSVYNALTMAGLVAAGGVFALLPAGSYRLAALLTAGSYALALLFALGLREVRSPEPAPARGSFAAAAREALDCGVTTIRSAAIPDDIDIGLKKAINKNMLCGPNIIACGKGLVAHNGHGSEENSVVMCSGVDAFMKAAREQLAAGADQLKMMYTGGMASANEGLCDMQMTDEEVKAVVDVAHRAGKKCFAHLSNDKAIRQSVLLGVDSVEHGYTLSEETAKLMAEHGTYFVPTISVSSSDDYLLAHGCPAHQVEKGREAAKTHRQGVTWAHKHGVKICVGTDLLPSDPVDGTNATVREIELLVQCGLSPMEAIKAATSTGAELCGLQDVTGTLKPGLMGDFMVVEGKPDENISDLRKLRLVAKHCRLIWSTLPNLNVRRFSVLAPGYEMKGGTFCDWRLI